ncbi:MAG: inositol monophosphatase family protein [Desulfobacterales bacterium]
MGKEVRVEIDDLVGFGLEVIRRAGAMALDFYGKGRPQVRFDDRVVTEAELVLTEFFAAELHRRFPEHRIFLHDAPAEGYSHERGRFLWSFDALEGVANFQAGIPLWGLSLALMENFWPLFGVFYMPATGDLFHARAGGRAFWGEREIRIPVCGGLNDESLLLTYSRFHQHFRTSFPGKIRSFGCTSAHIGYVATGRADAAVIANETFQGLAAARILLEAAGGRFRRLDGGDFDLNDCLDGRKIDEPLLAGEPGVLAAVQGCLSALK